jgi:predicted SAM-dependent methyltransferase
MLTIKKIPEGLTYLNIGCGDIFSTDWTNLDFTPQPNVDFVDIRDGLPFPNESFDVVYHSHLIEHLTLPEAKRFLKEACRVLKKGGLTRIATPDLEKIGRDYLNYLQQAWQNPLPQNVAKYQWVVLAFLDQLTREKSGGLMLEALLSQKFNKDFVVRQNGEELAPFFELAGQNKKSLRQRFQRFNISAFQHILAAGFKKIKSRFIQPSPQKTGEAHKWLYDKLSLRLLLEEAGFQNFNVKLFNQSNIPFWNRYQLDQSSNSSSPRKPDSIYVEAQK